MIDEKTQVILRRIGKFSIRILDIQEHFAEIQQLFKDMVIVSAQMQFHSMSIEYSAIHPLFKEVEQEREPFSYDIISSIDDDGNKSFKLEATK